MHAIMTAQWINKHNFYVNWNVFWTHHYQPHADKRKYKFNEDTFMRFTVYHEGAEKAATEYIKQAKSFYI